MFALQQIELKARISVRAFISDLLINRGRRRLLRFVLFNCYSALKRSRITLRPGWHILIESSICVRAGEHPVSGEKERTGRQILSSEASCLRAATVPAHPFTQIFGARLVNFKTQFCPREIALSFLQNA
jgi:hypothetical protein